MFSTICSLSQLYVSATVYVPAHRFTQSEEDSSNDLIHVKKKIVLNSGDELFAEIR